MTIRPKGKLVLEDGSIFCGESFGYPQSTSGEVVFTTGMVGYPESLTDPSFRGQVLIFTYPLIGNYGIPNDEKENSLLKNFESDQIQVKGIIVSDYSHDHNHWNSVRSLGNWLKENKIPALQGVDTRTLTKKLREQGVMLGKIVIEDENTGVPNHDLTNNNRPNNNNLHNNNIPNNNMPNNNNDLTNNDLTSKEVHFDDPNARNLVAEVSVKEKIVYSGGPLKIMVVDCGVKNNIIRNFLARGVTVIRVPWDYDFNKDCTEEDKYDGLFISNGPGDPKQCTETINNLKIALGKDQPIFGICLGSQLLALAAGADTYKLKYGHRGQNQPCLEQGTKRCYITSQNHGYAVDERTIPEDWESWFVNVNDGTNEGIRHKKRPFFAVQFHPEAYPGPEDTNFLFDRFIEAVKENKEIKNN